MPKEQKQVKVARKGIISQIVDLLKTLEEHELTEKESESLLKALCDVSSFDAYELMDEICDEELDSESSCSDCSCESGSDSEE